MQAPTFCRHVKIMLVFILLLIYCRGSTANVLVKGDSTCLSSWRYIHATKNLEGQCDEASWASGKRPDPLSTDFSFCTRKIIMDLSPRFTPPPEFKQLLNFIRDSMATCFHKTTGHNFIVSSFQPGSSESYKEFACCSMDNCRAELDGIALGDYVKPYNTDDLIYKDPSFNFKYASSWIDQIKKPNWVPCNFNSLVFITNRIIDFSTFNKPEIYDYFRHPCMGLCVEMTVILVARKEATQDMLYKYYSNITTNLYVVPDLNCVHKLVGCLLPCISTPLNVCHAEDFASCARPTPSLTSTTTSTTIKQTEKEPDSVYVMYVFALSSQLSIGNLDKIRNSLVEPMRQFSALIQEYQVTTAFFLPSTSDSTSWTSPMELAKVSFHQGDLLQVSHPIDQSIKYPTSAMITAVRRYNELKNSTHVISGGIHFSATKKVPKPIIILLTDYISENFIEMYFTGLNLAMAEFTFRIYAYNNYTYQFFLENGTVRKEDLFEINADAPAEISLDDGTRKDPEVKKNTTPPSPISETQLVLIVVGSVALLLILLIIGTVIYKQKVNWFNKIERFRNKHQESREESFTEDYWELTWDRLLIKSEKLGSGAYGQVFRGKIHGRPPCVEHMHSDRPHLASAFENCDVAIKMLPKYASESARKEFMNEIHLMKSIGYNENIVNILGCITVGQAVCLVLEYCPNRDLHQYVKALKVDVNISKSIDIKVNFTKEFMLFAWQVADGMRFLASKHIIHRDLAARNILIDGQKNAKISDFGLCIQLDENYAPTNSNKSFVSGSGRLPIKWLAIEALVNHEFSTKSDVWSFGMMLFETYSFGDTPFNQITPRKLADHLKEGNRPEKPTLCPDEMYELMERCWRELPEKRPTFQEILTQLTLFLENATKEYGYLDLEANTTEEYSKMSKLALAKSFNESTLQSDGTPKRKRHVFTSNSNADDHRPHYNHKITSTVGGKISKRNSQSSNQIYDSENVDPPPLDQE